jgi:hypothetical protein
MVLVRGIFKLIYKVDTCQNIYKIQSYHPYMNIYSHTDHWISVLVGTSCPYTGILPKKITIIKKNLCKCNTTFLTFSTVSYMDLNISRFNLIYQRILCKKNLTKPIFRWNLLWIQKKYSQTCIKRSPLGQIKNGLIR